ncbi:hypothetical protein [Candidatus Allofournierella merdipullorum]|uniref:hypothetical protein n=1 Tax=Candidatus Allofournierella merdipullorum TaxID=2838595 RepID=UPI00374F0D89
MTYKELRAIIDALENAHRASVGNSNNPRETARLFIRAVGAETAAQCVAAMVRRSSWDGRISRTAKDWSASVAPAADWDRLEDNAYSDAIHMAHLSQIAEAMPKELEMCAAERQQEERDTETVTLTLTPEEARRILRAVKSRSLYWTAPERVRRNEDAGRIRDTYRDTARMLEAQMGAQGVKP